MTNDCILETIHSHEDLVRLNGEQQAQLCREIRAFLVEHVARTGGHLASNLGVVELSVAIETVFDTAKDRLVFDVGHQSYVHKLLTGRQEGFDHLRSLGGMAGFPKPSESDTDAFVAGHASNSVSVALGMARANALRGERRSVLALLGDGALTGGLAYEGLNDAGASSLPLIVILNDNEMSIAPNVGGISKHLARVRMRPGYFGLKRAYRDFVMKMPGGKRIYRSTHRLKQWLKNSLLGSNMFENMGFVYYGPVDGHDLKRLIYLLDIARQSDRPVLFHVKTVKGKGYTPAEEDPTRFHGIGKFDPADGHSLAPAAVTFSDTFGRTMMELAQKDPKICAITAAMLYGTGLTAFSKAFPERTFDVGIAEGHAVSMAGGLAKAGMTPVVAIYSTFLQRAYDMILQDVAMLKLHVVFAVDRAGLVGEDGETHHGIFDVGFLRQAPGMTVLAPASCRELSEMLRWAVEDCTGPVAVRYPRGGDGRYTGSAFPSGLSREDLRRKGVHQMRQGRDITLVTYGTLSNEVLAAAELLAQRGIEAEVLRLLSVKPIPLYPILDAGRRTGKVVVIEETCYDSGIGQHIGYYLSRQEAPCPVALIDLGREFVTHGSNPELYRKYGLDPEGIARDVEVVYRNEE